MIQAKALTSHGLLAAVAVGCGKMETGIPWWVIFAAVIIFAALLAIFTTHSRKDDEPLTRGSYKELLAANNLELKTFKSMVDDLPMEPLGTSGAKYARLPDRTNVVKLPDGTIRLAFPVQLSAAFEGDVVGRLSAAVLKTSPPEQGKPDDG